MSTVGQECTFYDSVTFDSALGKNQIFLFREEIYRYVFVMKGKGNRKTDNC
jgi:hypothetical protein